MDLPGIKSAISKNKAWVSAVVTALVSFILPFIYAGIISLIGMLFGINSEGLGNFLAYLFTGISVALMCFLICRAHPESLWYTPVICNASTLLAGIGNYFQESRCNFTLCNRLDSIDHCRDLGSNKCKKKYNKGPGLIKLIHNLFHQNDLWVRTSY